MKVTMRPIGEVTPYDNNPRKVTQADVIAVANSIQEVGWRQPIVVDTKGVIVVGHTRYQAAIHLGLEKVPVHVMNAPESIIRKYRLADNRLGERTEWDFAAFRVEIGALDSPADLLDLGFEHQELALGLAEEEDLADPLRDEGVAGHDPDNDPDKPIANVQVHLMTDAAKAQFESALASIGVAMRKYSGNTYTVRLPAGGEGGEDAA